MSDTQRLDWLERNPQRLVCMEHVDGRYTFMVVLGEPGGQKYTEERVTLRQALDDGVKEVL